jgi:hypothetical protein
MSNERIRYTLFQKISPILTGLLFFISCRPIGTVDENQNRTRESNVYAGSGSARVYESNPKVLTGSYVTSIDYSDKLVTQFITDNDFLETSCDFTQNYTFSPTVPYTDTTPNDCFNVLNNRNAATEPLESDGGSWNFTTETDEFYQVNTYYHVNLIPITLTLPILNRSLLTRILEIFFMMNPVPLMKVLQIGLPTIWLIDTRSENLLFLNSRVWPDRSQS